MSIIAQEAQEVSILLYILKIMKNIFLKVLKKLQMEKLDIQQSFGQKLFLQKLDIF